MLNCLTRRFWNANQSWNYEAIWGDGANTIRIRIRRNAYDRQSYAEAYLFSERDARWNPLARRDGEELSVCERAYRGVPDGVPTISYTSRTLAVDHQLMFLEDEETLVKEIRVILDLPGEKERE